MKTESPREIAERIVRETILVVPGKIADRYIDAIEAALNAERERCAKIADLWANAKSCTIHDDDPCCHVRTGARIAEKIRGTNAD